MILLKEPCDVAIDRDGELSIDMTPAFGLANLAAVQAEGNAKRLRTIFQGPRPLCRVVGMPDITRSSAGSAILATTSSGPTLSRPPRYRVIHRSGAASRSPGWCFRQASGLLAREGKLAAEV